MLLSGAGRPCTPFTGAGVLTASDRKQMEGGERMKIAAIDQALPVVSTHKHG
jgi:hypothetical protein